MPVDLVVERRYLERGYARVEQVTWRHVPDPPLRWTFQRRRWRRPKMVQVRDAASVDVGKGRELPDWCAPGMEPNRWVWISAENHAADLGWIEPDGVETERLYVRGQWIDGVTRFYGPASLWWSYYEIPLREGCVLL